MMIRMKYLKFLWHNQLFDCFRQLYRSFFLHLHSDYFYFVCLISFEKIVCKIRESFLNQKSGKKAEKNMLLLLMMMMSTDSRKPVFKYRFSPASKWSFVVRICRKMSTFFFRPWLRVKIITNKKQKNLI